MCCLGLQMDRKPCGTSDDLHCLIHDALDTQQPVFKNQQHNFLSLPAELELRKSNNSSSAGRTKRHDLKQSELKQ